jgi:YesN/AraC family two-component response regulator
MKKSDFARAKSYFLEALINAKELSLLQQLLFSYEKLAELSSITGDFKSAYEYLSNAVMYRDSVFSADARRQMAEMQTRFEVSKMNDEIKIQQLTIQQQEADLKRANLIRAIVFIGLILSILFSVFLIWMYFQKRRAYQVLLLQNIELARLEQSEKAHNPMKESLVKDIPDTKYQKSSLTDDQKEAIYEKLLEMLEYGRVFLNHDLSVEDLADKLDTNRRYLSQVVNELHGSNFSTFINEYRVKEARRLLLDPEKHHFSLEGIAHAAGFNSRISFNNAFKKITGLTPAYFQKSSMNKLK